MAAGAGLVWGMVLLTDKRFEGSSALGIGALAAALPWLHVRYAPLSAGLVLIALIRCRLHAGKLLALILPALASAAALLGFFHAVYGGFSPAAISALPDDFSYWASLSWRRSATYLCALFLDSAGRRDRVCAGAAPRAAGRRPALPARTGGSCGRCFCPSRWRRR